jgi:hypothetical protein
VSRSLLIVALALAVAVVVIEARVVAGGDTWNDLRYHTEVAPPRIAAATQIMHGELPRWWDGAGLGVPLLAEPSHGAAYPPLWLATGPRALDLILIAHVLWLALGAALWARARGASELGALVGGLLLATTGVVAAAALRGALPALSFLPWIGWAATRLPEARARSALVIGACFAAILLAGELAIAFDALVITVAFSTRATWRWLAVAIVAGAAIGAVQWVPALALHGAGASVHGLSLAHVIELIVPVPAASHDAWAPCLYAGGPLVALAATRAPDRRMGVVMIAFVILALVVGRGGWPAWLGAPELHVAALAILAAVAAASGLDALLAGERRAIVAVAAGAVVTAVALGGVLAARGTSPPIVRALVDGGIGAACMAGALVAIRGVRPLALALLIAPGVGALHATAPTIDRASLAEPQWAHVASAPVVQRFYRPDSLASSADDNVDEAVATLAGASAARFDLALGNTRDPARAPIEDRVWLAASNGGGALLDRFGIALAVLPTAATAGMTELGRRGGFSWVRYPATPPASVIGNWTWLADTGRALAQLFPPAGTRGAGRGRIVLAGTGTPSEEADTQPRACTIERWDPGAIDLACTADVDAYAVISSSARDGWSVEVDGAPATWVTADVIRRAVAIPAGTHAIRWRYAAPGLALGVVLAAAGLALLAALGWFAHRQRES